MASLNERIENARQCFQELLKESNPYAEDACRELIRLERKKELRLMRQRKERKDRTKSLGR